MKIEVIKKDGSIEPFYPQKIARVTHAAGLTTEQAQKLADTVTEWVKAQNKPQITTLEIRNKVVELLRQANEYAANLFVWYEKTKEPKPPREKA